MSTAWCILNVVEIVEAEIDGPIIPLVLLLDSFAQFYLDWLDSGRCPQCFHENNRIGTHNERGNNNEHGNNHGFTFYSFGPLHLAAINSGYAETGVLR
jgi:hypothetical protein